MAPLPLSQGVLLSLLQQIACDISKDTSRKLTWIRDVAVAINPADPMISMHVRPIFEQVYQIVNHHHRSLPTSSSADLSNIRLVLHVLNSMLMTCKWFFDGYPLMGKEIVASTTPYFSLICQDYYVGMYKVVGFFFFWIRGTAEICRVGFFWRYLQVKIVVRSFV